jgi:tetraacyldisaccharide 4'-kinase
VLCIGNLTVGGSGKTPAAIAFGKAAAQGRLHVPGFLTRGYGGSVTGRISSIRRP